MMRENVLYYDFVPTRNIPILSCGHNIREAGIKFYTPSWAESGTIQVEIIIVGISYISYTYIVLFTRLLCFFVCTTCKS